MALYIDASRAATGILEVLAMIIVLSINLRPVQGRQVGEIQQKFQQFHLPFLHKQQQLLYLLLPVWIYFVEVQFYHFQRDQDKTGSSKSYRTKSVYNPNAGFHDFKWSGLVCVYMYCFFTGHFWIIVTGVCFPWLSSNIAMVSVTL